nr:MAG TPA: hypothetical protein [Caudoviricetes sp.]
MRPSPYGYDCNSPGRFDRLLEYIGQSFLIPSRSPFYAIYYG